MARENSQCGMRDNMTASPLLRGEDDGPIRRRLSGGRRDDDGMTEIVLEGDDDDDTERFDERRDASDSDAHHQVMEMSATIEILTRDFENLQRELLDAYKKLQEYSDHDPRLHPRSRQPSSTASPTKVGATTSGGVVSSAMAKLRTGNYGDCGCSHETEVDELKQIIGVKDTALREAVNERNEYKIRLERAEDMLREAQIHPHDSRNGSGRGSGLHVHTSSRSSTFSGASIPYGMTSTSPVNFTPSLLASSSCASSTASSNKGLPKNERFDTESTYQSKENDELFWRRQYRDAVRMRKHNGQQAPTPVSLSAFHGGGGASTTASAKPSLKIFYPNTNRHKGITDENVPFTRYIGISTRQNEIIKEQHRILS